MSQRASGYERKPNDCYETPAWVTHALVPHLRPLDVVLEATDVPLASGAQVTVCHGTSALSARMVRVGERYAQLRLSKQLVAARGDRFVLRSYPEEPWTELVFGRLDDGTPYLAMELLSIRRPVLASV